MDKTRNPFAPGAGFPPPALVGRETIIAEATSAFARIRCGNPTRSFLLVGLRGVGKTVLLNRFHEIAEDEGFKGIFFEVPESKRLPSLLVPALRKVLLSLDRTENISAHIRQCWGVLKSFARSCKIEYGDFGFSIDPEVGSADTGDLETDLTDVFLTVGEAAKASGKPVAIFIDEMQYLEVKELSALIMAIHRVCQKQLPLLLVGAGLPQLVGLAGKTKSYSERLFSFPKIGQLEQKDARSALQQPVMKRSVQFAVPALDEIIRLTEGYPYFIQEWGSQCWNMSLGTPINIGVVKAAEPRVIQALDNDFFRVRFDRLTPREKQYLRAMAELRNHSPRSGEIAAVLKVEVQSIAPIRSTLIKKGMIFSPAHGDTAFTVPLFGDFMKRIIPDFKRALEIEDSEE